MRQTSFKSIIFGLVILIGVLQVYFIFMSKYTRQAPTMGVRQRNRGDAFNYNESRWQPSEQIHGSSEPLALRTMVAGVILLEDDPYHSLTPEQARKLYPLLASIKDDTLELDRSLRKVKMTFTEEQKNYLKMTRASQSQALTGMYLVKDTEESLHNAIMMLKGNLPQGPSGPEPEPEPIEEQQ
ncbi:MAG: hypothetical protein RDV48_12285 [Candidatus Eremiobacteraeota bacterium]|nr:hypothetical protein [Candidatus Eremiobacteraeota bacterium]